MKLHRGYCVSERCAHFATENNITFRFERCAGQRGKKRGFKLSLTKLDYCRTHKQELARINNSEPMEEGHRMFLTIIALLLAMNLLGTAYDIMLQDDSKSK